jgi:hypothetical protein
MSTIDLKVTSGNLLSWNELTGGVLKAPPSSGSRRISWNKQT